MKRLLVLVAVLVVPSARAQWAVFDATNFQQAILSSAQEIAKFVEVIDKQVEQLRSLQDQAATLHHYVDLFGNPATITPPSIQALSGELLRPELGRPPADLVAAADPGAAMLDDGLGAFDAIGREFLTPDGVRVPRADSLYRGVAAVQNLTANYRSVAASSQARRVALKAEIAKITQALAAASTDAEVQKLEVVLTGLGTALQGAEHELSQATASVLVQDVATRTDAGRQTDARREELTSQFTEALQNYGRTFQLFTVPTDFPTQ